MLVLYNVIKLNYMKNNINLGKAFENLKTTMRNPMLIHKIHDAFLELNHRNFFNLGIYASMSKGRPIENIITEIILSHEENPKSVEESIGKELWNTIKEYRGL